MWMKIQIIFFLLLSLTGFGQDGIPYLELKLRNSGSAIDVEWTVLAGNTCQDVEIWRGSDSLNLSQVFIYTGICGDNDSAKSYNYIDQPPVAGVRYYYRIIIITDRTELKSLISYPQNTPEFFPNPAKSHIDIVRDPLLDYSGYYLYDIQGKQLDAVFNPKVIESMEFDNYPPGTYILEFNEKSGSSYQNLIIE